MRRRSKHLIDNEAGFDLEVMGGASAASRLLVELPTLSSGNVSRARSSAAAYVSGSGVRFLIRVYRTFPPVAPLSGPWQLRTQGVERSGVFSDCFLIRGLSRQVGIEPHAGSVRTSSLESASAASLCNTTRQTHHEEKLHSISGLMSTKTPSRSSSQRTDATVRSDSTARSCSDMLRIPGDHHIVQH